ncbi:lytic transglycosylase domain-containing protein [Microbacterium sp. W1N]|uniref:aggregation-promoting factor C-terminal-like domain-containing protein n=1 Tax=Microbacterium festucae TaxID=2977531 RepID=UPI0021C156AB|nr:lytic transglycosylase domain-containing protein [Microbacterium festucae]MCT9820296.1 lytic transglycosylase domain-containing protein [Microbacterium festucae]
MTSGNELTPASSSTAPARRSAARPPVRTRQRWSRRRGVLGVFAAVAVAGFAASAIAPLGAVTSQAHAAELEPISLYASTIADAQALVAASDEPDTTLQRDALSYTVYVTPKPTPTPTPVAAAKKSTSSGSSGSSGWAPPFVSPDPGSAQAIAYEMVRARGWGDDQFACLVALWKKESGWRVNAYNKGSGAYGIPQALPGSKMASAGADWETNPATQISWGLGYVGGRYGTPCGAWDHSQRKGWY